MDKEKVLEIFNELVSGTSSTSGTVMFNLPAGYRPKRQLVYRITTSGTGGTNTTDQIVVKTNGDVLIVSENAQYGVYLSGICFSIL